MRPFNVFQTAYVVGDLDAGLARIGKLYGMTKFRVRRNVAIQTSGGPSSAHVALAFVGSGQIEIIEPAGGADSCYRGGLAADPAVLRLHHVATVVRDETTWNALMAELEAEGVDMPIRGEAPGLMRYAYADYRDQLGHYLEYVHPMIPLEKLFADLPRYPG